MKAIPKGATVRQVAKPIEGVIEAGEGSPATRFNEDTSTLEYHVGYTNAAGEKHFRWFSANEIEEVQA